MSAASPRRNDPCPCESGRKFKQCCAKKDDAAVAGASAVPGAMAPGSAAARRERKTRRDQAEAFLARGDLARAEAAYRAAIELAPDDEASLLGLATVRLARGAPTDAAAILDRAVAVAEATGRAIPVAVHRTRADACLQAGRGDDAVAAAAAGVAKAPRDPGALATLAMVQERTNDLAAAAATAAAAERLAPGHISVLTMAARIARRRGDAAAALERLNPLVARSDLSPFQRQVALHERAMALEAVGRFDDAWDAFVVAGKAVAADPAARRLDRGAWPRRVAACRRGLTRAMLERVPPPAAIAASGASTTSMSADLGFRPAFLVGFPRSGTTLTESVLAAHPAVCTTDEQPFLGDVKRQLAAATGGSLDDLPALIARLTPALVATLRAGYARRVRAALGTALQTDPAAGPTRLVDKLPLNLVDVGLIDALFPEARLVVALRDPRDVCLSCFQQWFGLNTAMVHFLDPAETVAFYATVMQGWLEARSVIRLSRLEIRYEDTTADLPAQARRMLEFLGLPWDDKVLGFHGQAHGRAISTPSYAAVSEPVHRRAVARWRRYAEPLEAWRESLSPFIEAFGYDTDADADTDPD